MGFSTLKIWTGDGKNHGGTRDGPGSGVLLDELVSPNTYSMYRYQEADLYRSVTQLSALEKLRETSPKRDSWSFVSTEFEFPMQSWSQRNINTRKDS